VLLSAIDPEDALHRPAAEALIKREHEAFVIPAIVFTEVMVGALRLGDRSARQLEESIDDIISQVYPIDRELALAAAAIRARRRSIRAPDALVLATGWLLDAEVLTADKAWRGEPGRVTVVEAS
jgi:predicted nucleic acid-binding protein